MKDEDKTKAELIKALKTLRKERGESVINNIIERKQAEEKLEDTEEYLKILFDRAPDAYYVNDLKGNFVDGNLAAERITGYKREELIGKSFLKLKLLSLADIPKAVKLLAKNLRGQPTGPDEFVLNRKDNSKVVVEISTYPVKIKRKTLVLGIARDITERKKAEKALVESEERYRTVFENTGTATAITEEDMTISMANTQTEKLSGYSKEEIENKMKWTDFVLKEDLEKMKKYHITRRKAGESPPTEYEFRMVDKKGNTKDIFMKIGMIPDTKKSVASLIDITELRQAEERIKHLNLVLRAVRSVNQLITKEKNREKLLKGASANLIKTRGYHNTWIALSNEEGKLKICAEAGLGKDFFPMIELLKEDKLPACVQKVLKQEDMVTIEDPVSICTDCPLAHKYSGRGAMIARLEQSGKFYGIMSVSAPAYFINDKEEQSLFKEISGDIAFGLRKIELAKKMNKQTHNLKERVKELSCLFKLSSLIEKTDISSGEAIQEIVNFLPSAWQYPKITCAQIILGNKKFKTENFKETIWKQSSDIKVQKKTIGTLEVYYLEKRPEMDEGPFQKEERTLAATIAETIGNFIDKTQSRAQLQQSYQKLKRAMNATIETMSKIVETKDPYTAGHQQRVSQLATAIAKELNLSQDKVEGIRIASLIHDIGKIGLPAEILSKPTKLTDIEFSLIKGHSQIGHDILKSIDFSYPVARIVLQHHERLNGSGYPNKLKGDKILLEAKIIGVVDVVEAMSSHRPYRPALGMDAAVEEIHKNKGILYDPEAVEVCLRLFKEKGFKFE